MGALEGPLRRAQRNPRSSSAKRDSANSNSRSSRPKAGSANSSQPPLVSLATTYSPVP